MRISRTFPVLCVVALALVSSASSAHAQCVTKWMPLDAGSPGLGGAVAIGATRAIVGAPWDDEVGDRAGAVYVFDLATGQTLKKILAPGGPYDEFGSSVAMSGERLVVSAPRSANEPGTVYVLDIVSGQQLHELAPSLPPVSFGQSVAIDGDRVLVGDPHSDEVRGVVYVYDVVTGAELLRLTDTDPQPNEAFGFSIAIDGGTAVVGVPGEGGSEGAAKLFDLTTGVELLAVQRSDPVLDSGFGRSVAIDGNRVAVGAPFDEGSAALGAVHVFDRSGQQLLELRTEHESGPVGFGSTVTVEGGRVLVGVDPTGGELAYVFGATSGSELFVLDTGNDGLDGFGAAVAIHGERWIVGAPWNPLDWDLSGTAHVFEDCDFIGTSYCGPANLNSTGQSAEIRAAGSPAAADNELRLYARLVPANQSGYFLASRSFGFVPFPPGSEGNLCLSGAIGRFRDTLQSSGAMGTFFADIDLTDVPPPLSSAMAGERWYFQVWFRDANPLPTSNFTDGVALLFR